MLSDDRGFFHPKSAETHKVTLFRTFATILFECKRMMQETAYKIKSKEKRMENMLRKNEEEKMCIVRNVGTNVEIKSLRTLTDNVSH